MLDDARMFDVLAADIDRLDAAGPAVAAGPDAAVAACPGWAVTDLVGHVGQVHWRLARMLRQGEQFRSLRREPPPPPADEVVAWRAEGSRAVLAALRAADLDGPSEMWAGPVATRFWLRRMVHETAVHRWDVEAALGEAPTALDADAAVDAVDELFELFVPMVEASRWAAVAGPDGASIHAHATDTEGEWLVRLSDAGVVVSKEHAKGDVAARGAASDIALVLWNRQPAAVLECFGDEALLRRFLDTATF